MHLVVLVLILTCLASLLIQMSSPLTYMGSVSEHVLAIIHFDPFCVMHAVDSLFHQASVG